MSTFDSANWNCLIYLYNTVITHYYTRLIIKSIPQDANTTLMAMLRLGGMTKHWQISKMERVVS